MNDIERESKAKELYHSGHRLSFSTGITGYITYGYGQLDDYGFWEYPLRYEDLNERHKSIVDAANIAIKANF